MVKYSSNVVTELTLGRNHTNALFVILVLQKTTDLKTHQHNHTREKQFQGNTCKLTALVAYLHIVKMILLHFLNLILVFYQFYVLVIYALVKRYFGNLLQNSHRE